MDKDKISFAVGNWIPKRLTPKGIDLFNAQFSEIVESISKGDKQRGNKLFDLMTRQIYGDPWNPPHPEHTLPFLIHERVSMLRDNMFQKLKIAINLDEFEEGCFHVIAVKLLGNEIRKIKDGKYVSLLQNMITHDGSQLHMSAFINLLPMKLGWRENKSLKKTTKRLRLYNCCSLSFDDITNIKEDDEEMGRKGGAQHDRNMQTEDIESCCQKAADIAKLKEFSLIVVKAFYKKLYLWKPIDFCDFDTLIWYCKEMDRRQKNEETPMKIAFPREHACALQVFNKINLRCNGIMTELDSLIAESVVLEDEDKEKYHELIRKVSHERGGLKRLMVWGICTCENIK